MRTRYMRMMLFFDLPTTTAAERKVYTQFRKQLIKDGFMMMQQSVYTKLVLNPTAVKLTRDRISKFIPEEGLVQLLCVTERQFASIEYMVGEADDSGIQSVDRVVVL